MCSARIKPKSPGSAFSTAPGGKPCWVRGDVPASRSGCRVEDVGAGPGYATWDLAEVVGAAGTVVAVERSPRFSAELRREAAARCLGQVRVLEGDLMELAPLEACDMAWCRWVASFVPSIVTLVGWLRESVRPAGRVVLHEYLDYGSWRFAPPRPALQAFVAEVMASWRGSGGEPDAAGPLICELRRNGFRVLSTRPHVFTTAPGELTCQWPAAFVAANPIGCTSWDGYPPSG